MGNEMCEIVVGVVFRFLTVGVTWLAYLQVSVLHKHDNSPFPEEADNTQQSNIACEDIILCTPLMSSSIHSGLIS